MIKKWRAHLQSVGHCAEIGLAQNIVGQIIESIDLEQRFEPDRGSARRHPPIMRLRLVIGLQKKPFARREPGKPQDVGRSPVKPQLFDKAPQHISADAGGWTRVRQSQAMAPACAHVFRVALVAGEELVAAVASEHDFHMSRGLPRQIPRGHA